MKRKHIICFLLVLLIAFNTGCSYYKKHIYFRSDIYKSDTQILVIEYNYLSTSVGIQLRKVGYQDGRPRERGFSSFGGDLYPYPDCNYIISDIDNDQYKLHFVFKIYDKKVICYLDEKLEDTFYLCEGLTLDELNSDDFDLRSIGF